MPEKMKVGSVRVEPARRIGQVEIAPAQQEGEDRRREDARPQQRDGDVAIDFPGLGAAVARRILQASRRS